MPLTPFQKKVAKILAPLRTPDSHLAGGAAIHTTPNSKRFSNDLDYFHDSVERVASAFSADQDALAKAGLTIDTQMNQSGFIRAIVSDTTDSTKVEWSHDSAWRFLPPIKVPEIGYQLDPLDLAINKLLALAGRDEPRDFLDILYLHDNVLSLGAVCWAAVSKDPGFTPHSLLALIRRRGKYQPEDFERLQLTEPVDLVELKKSWLNALDEAEQFIESRSPSEIGCLYYSKKQKKFVTPTNTNEDIVPHYGRPGGLYPKFSE